MKERITITLDSKAISAIDSLIGRDNIKNRSQAIEAVIMKHSRGNGSLKAVILAGKKPSRESIIQTLDQLEKAGVNGIIVAGGKNNENVFSILKMNDKFSDRSTFLREEKSMGTAGAIKSAESQLQETFILVFSDINYKINFNEMLESHNGSGNLATMALTIPDKKADYLDKVRVGGNKITSFEYKSKAPTKLQSAGIFIFDPKSLDYFPSEGSLEEDVLPELAKKGKLGFFLFDTAWKHNE